MTMPLYPILTLFIGLAITGCDTQQKTDNAQVEIEGIDATLGQVTFVAHSITYNVHTNTVTIQGS